MYYCIWHTMQLRGDWGTRCTGSIKKGLHNMKAKTHCDQINYVYVRDSGGAGMGHEMKGHRVIVDKT